MSVLYFIYQWLIFMPIFLVLSILTALTTTIGSTLGNVNFWGYYPGKIWSIITCYLALCPVKVVGLENIDKNTSYVFVANHQGAFDIFLIYGFMGHNFKWMLRNGVAKIPFIGDACRSGGHIMVDEHGTSGMRQTLRQALDTLKEGMSLVIFPEGTRSNDGHLNRFKKGAYQLAGLVRLPVVPMSIDGSYNVVRKGSLIMHPHRMTLTIHKPLPAISSKEGTEAGLVRLMVDSQNIIAKDLGEKLMERPIVAPKAPKVSQTASATQTGNATIADNAATVSITTPSETSETKAPSVEKEAEKTPNENA